MIEEVEKLPPTNFRWVEGAIYYGNQYIGNVKDAVVTINFRIPNKVLRVK